MSSSMNIITIVVIAVPQNRDYARAFRTRALVEPAPFFGRASEVVRDRQRPATTVEDYYEYIVPALLILIHRRIIGRRHSIAEVFRASPVYPPNSVAPHSVLLIQIAKSVTASGRVSSPVSKSRADKRVNIAISSFRAAQKRAENSEKVRTPPNPAVLRRKIYRRQSLRC